MRQATPFFPLLLLSALSSRVLAQDPPTAPPAPARSRIGATLQQEFAAIARQVFPAVVTMRTFVRDDTATAAAPPPPAAPAEAGWIAAPTHERDYPGFRPHGSASAFFVADGDLVTVLSPLQVDAERLVDLVEIETSDGHRILCDVLGIEPTLAIAVLRCAVFPNWDRPVTAALPFADSDATEVGNLLLGFGDPFGPERYLATGLLAAKPSRDCYQEMLSATFLQATLPVPAGALGGPLVDLDGHVVGLLAQPEFAAAASPGQCWALPSKLLHGLYESIRDAGTMRSPWLGFSVMSRAELATTRGLAAFQALQKPPHGILIENVFAGSPAHRAGIQPEDFLTHLNGKEIHAPVDFQRQLYLAGVGKKAELRLFRAGNTFATELTIEARPDAAKPR